MIRFSFTPSPLYLYLLLRSLLLEIMISSCPRNLPPRSVPVYRLGDHQLISETASPAYRSAINQSVKWFRSHSITSRSDLRSLEIEFVLEFVLLIAPRMKGRREKKTIALWSDNIVHSRIEPPLLSIGSSLFSAASNPLHEMRYLYFVFIVTTLPLMIRRRTGSGDKNRFLRLLLFWPICQRPTTLKENSIVVAVELMTGVFTLREYHLSWPICVISFMVEQATPYREIYWLTLRHEIVSLPRAGGN